MACSLPSVKLFLASSATDALPLISIFRRGYAAATYGAVSSGFGKELSRGANAMVGKVEQRAGPGMEDETRAWAPDPVTGYYRPQNCAPEIDAAELREMLLNHKGHRPH